MNEIPAELYNRTTALKLRFFAFLLFFCFPPGRGQTFDDLASRAGAARDANDIPRAIDLYRQALQLNSQWAEGWWYLGTLAYDGDRYDMARDALARCVELQPQAAPAFGLLGLSEFQLNDYSSALAHIQRSLLDPQLDPQMVEVLRFHEGMLLARTGQFERAMESYSVFAGGDHPPAQLLTAIGISALQEPLLPADIPEERRALFDAAGKTVWTAMSQDAAHSAAAFAKLLEAYPGSSEVHALVDAYLLVASQGGAGDALRHELEANPSNSAAAAMLACILLNHGNPAGALPLATKAAQLAPKLSVAQYALGRALLETGDTAGGAQHLALAAQLDPKDIESGIALASAYRKAGRMAEARVEENRTMALARGTFSHAQP